MQTGGYRQIKRLEIAGFKSFGGRKVFEFQPGITAIVGPNGSGKSNVADAIRWVLGEQKNKRMRISTSEDVIFYGTKRKPQASLAEVSILLDNSKGNFAIDASEVEITRQLFRSGESQYRLNGRKTKLSQLEELLAQAGFGIESYTVVGQGMIDQLLTATGPERKMLFDEASGIRQFDLKRSSAMKNLKSSSENLSQVQGILQELEPATKVLQRQTANVDKASSLREELETKRKAYLGYELARIETQKTRLSSEIAAAENQLKEVIIEQEKLHTQTSNKDSARSLQPSQAEHLKALELERDNLTQQLLLLQSEHTVLKAKQNSEKPNNTAVKELAVKQTAVESELKKLNKALEDHSLKTQKIEKEIIAINNQLAIVTKQLEGLRTQLSKSQKKEFVNHALGLVQLVRTQLRASNSRKQIDSSMHKLSQMLELALQDNAASLAVDIVKLQNQISKYMATREEIVERQTQEVIGLRSIELDIASLLMQKKELIGMKNNKSSEYSQTSKEITKHEKTITSLQSKLKLLDKEITMQREQLYANSQSQNDASTSELTQTLERLASERTRLELNLEQSKENQLRLDQEKTSLQNRMNEWFKKPIHFETKPTVVKVDLHSIEQLEFELKSIETIDPALIEEANEAATRVEFLREQEADLQIAIEDAHNLIVTLENDIKNRFKKSFAKLNIAFGHFFTQLFSGGTAELQLAEQEDDEYGIEISVSPAGKRGKSINALSGGEKALAAVALLAAILTTNPSPFIVLDEVDAALDDENSTRFTEVMRELAAKNQLIVITHNHETMQAASNLFGVTTGEKGDSEVLSLVLQQASELVEA